MTLPIGKSLANSCDEFAKSIHICRPAKTSVCSKVLSVGVEWICLLIIHQIFLACTIGLNMPRDAAKAGECCPLKSQNYCQYNAVNKTPIKRLPLVSCLGHLFAIPMSFLLFLPYLVASKSVIYVVWLCFQQDRTDESKIEVTAVKVIQTLVSCRLHLIL